ncbi:MAG: rRNA (adenine1518-N6/adenine1519-N6)-dimethyltransferase [Actinomycetota bacterium]|nr:rRNA (adenine1518-N6/adenine1519-N6)-dimethyltransferase [Actinomycetota bacterium]
MTLSRTQVLDLMARHQLHPSRALGQNFVVDGNTVRRIARLAGVGPGDRVVEIGAGLGSLTLALAETGAWVTAVELDRHLIPALREALDPVLAPDLVAGATKSGARTGGGRVEVIEGDALTLDWASVLGDHDGWVLVANLPYNVATPLVADLLDGVPAIARMLVMVQREVGERLAAKVGDDAYGAVSVKVAYWATAKVVGRVPATVFVPQPKVESALVAIERRPQPATDADFDRLFELVRTGFGQRRKMLRRALAGVIEADAFECAGVRPEARAEELDVETWGRLAACAPSPS